MKIFRQFLFLLFVLVLAGLSVFLKYFFIHEKEKKAQFHPLQYLDVIPTKEALTLRKVKDLINYSKPAEALKVLSYSDRELICWKRYFRGIAKFKAGYPDACSELLRIPEKCAPRHLALAFLIENCPNKAILEKIPVNELKEEETLKLRWKLNEEGIEKIIFCKHPLLAKELGIRINKKSRQCHRERYNVFFSKGQWKSAISEARHLDRYSLARAYFYARKYRTVVRLLRSVRSSKELYLKFRAYLRLGSIKRAISLQRQMKKAGLYQDYLWQLAMFYYPEEKGFNYMKEYLTAFPHGKFADSAKRYLKLRDYCLRKEKVPVRNEFKIAVVNFSSPSFYEEIHLRKAALLKGVFLYQEALEELEFLRRKKDSPLLQYLDGVLRSLKGDYLSGIRLIRKSLGGTPIEDEETLRVLYPFPFEDKIRKISYRNGIDPYLLAALIHQESLFNPEARSSAGAIGLMQLMKFTFKSTVIRMNAEFSNPYDPVENLKVGIRHFSELLNYYNGNIVLALAAYNAGIERVNRWKELLPCEDTNTFIELIPIKQTRNYVKFILMKRKIYRRLYEKSGVDFWR